MIKVGEKVERVSQLIKKLRQKSVVIHGFPISIQLLLFRSIPLLMHHLTFAKDHQTFLDRRHMKLPMLKTYHIDNILQLENDLTVSFFPLLYIISSHSLQLIYVPFVFVASC